MTSIINSLQPQAGDVVCDFGWYYGSSQEMAEFFYATGVNSDIFPVGASTLTAGVTLNPSVGTTTISVNGTLSTSIFEATGQVMVQDQALDWALVRYTGTTQSSGLTTSLTGCTTLATSTGAAITFASSNNVFDARLFWTQTPLQQVITFDAIDNNDLGLPSVQVPNQIEIVRYVWDFGNGQMGAGPYATTIYNYSQPPPNMVAKLMVIDSLSREYSCAHPVNLQPFSTLYGFAARS